MKKGTKIVLWIVVAVLALISVNSFSGRSSDPNTGKLVEAIGRVIGTVFGLAAAGLGAVLLFAGRARDAAKNQDGDRHSGSAEADAASVAAKHSSFWKIAAVPLPWCTSRSVTKIFFTRLLSSK